MAQALFLLVVICVQLCACESLAILSTPQKQRFASNNLPAKQAEQFFWQTLHRGDYKNIDKALRLLMIAYLKNPQNPDLAAHIGFLHTWKITERDRIHPNPRMPDEIVLAKKYFRDALELAPNNPIFQGFFGDTQLVEGQIFVDKREQVRGYYQLKRAISSWPQFNYFTAGYPMSTLPAQDPFFQEGLEWQWLTLNLCAGQVINRKHPDFSPFMNRETHMGRERACWNSWTAPFNFEGFFLNMGDMLVKAGQWQTAVQIYQNAKLDKDYIKWPFREILEQRITHAQQNIRHFQNKNSSNPILFDSGVGCQICHRQSK